MRKNVEDKLFPANILLEREPDSDYLDEWALIVQKDKRTDLSQTELSVVMFRLNAEWFALNTSIFAEVAPRRQCHRIPHISNPFWLGFVNLRGQIFVSVSLHHLLSLDSQVEIPSNNKIEPYQRLLAIKKDDIKFTFLADEVFGVYRLIQSTLQDPPVTAAKSRDNYLKGIFNWMNHRVGLLDESIIFSDLKRKMCERK
jgi:chemotaxis-related protein WspD